MILSVRFNKPLSIYHTDFRRRVDKLFDEVCSIFDDGNYSEVVLFGDASAYCYIAEKIAKVRKDINLTYLDFYIGFLDDTTVSYVEQDTIENCILGLAELGVNVVLIGNKIESKTNEDGSRKTPLEQGKYRDLCESKIRAILSSSNRSYNIGG